MKFNHIPVLLKETIEALKIKKDGIYIDATAGGGGHSLEILKKVGIEGKLILIDQNEDAIEHLKKKFKGHSNVIIVKDNFKNIQSILENINVEKVDGILADFGVSSYQIDKLEKGFSYENDKALLDMRMDKNSVKKASDILNYYNKKELLNIFIKIGEIKYSISKKITNEIINQRQKKQLCTAFDLKEIIKLNIPNKVKPSKIYSNVFRALRTEVNDELEVIKIFLQNSINLLKSKGRIVVISFNSLEDRVVKKYFKNKSEGCICPDSFPVCKCGRKKEIIIIKKLVAKDLKKEIKNNIRARSAILRIAEKI